MRSKHAFRLLAGPVARESGVMARVRGPEGDGVPSSGGRMIDDSLDFEHAPRTQKMISLAVPPRTQGMLPPAPLHLMMPPLVTATVGTNSAIRAFAGFPAAPTTLFATPHYALLVMAKKRVLRLELASAQARRSPDVALYENALELADRGAVRTGIALMVLGFVLPFVVIFLLAA